MKWGPSEDVPATYVNHILISHDGPQFWMVFGVLDLHTELRSIPEGLEVDFPKYLEVKPIVKLAMTPDTMVSFANAINTNLAKYAPKQEAEKDGPEKP